MSRFLVAGLAMWCAISPPLGAAPDPEKALDRLQARLADEGLSREQISALRGQAETLRGAARDTSRAARDEALALRDLLEALGSPPADGEPEESAEIVKRRRELNRSLGRFDSEVKQAELVVKRVDAFQAKLSVIERTRITTGFLVRSTPPYRADMWIQGTQQLIAGIRALPTRDYAQYQTSNLVIVPVIALLAGIGVAAGLISRRLLRRYGRDQAITEPSYARRTIAAVCVGVSRGILPVLVFVGLLIAGWAYYLKPLFPADAAAPISVFAAVVIYLLGSGLARAAFAPTMPHWRLVPISPQSSVQVGRRIHLLLAAITFNIVITFVFERMGTTPPLAPELATAHTFLISTFVGLLLLALCIPRLWQVEVPLTPTSGITTEAEPKNWLWPLARLLVMVAALAMLITSFLGYRMLADFVRQSTISTLLLTTVVLGLHVLLSESLSLLLARDSGPAASVRRLLALSDEGAKSLNFWLAVVIDLFLLVVGVAGVLAFWGIPLADMWEGVKALAQGIQLGSYNLSLVDVAFAVIVFIVIVAVTRLVQRFFERLLPQTRLDIGVRTAVSAAIGYVGMTVALLSAISTLGIDLTKLALIAGALSVGIGFGLQNIVNNFVSGLILLIERPVKIGDWVVIGNVEGKVKQINVRSTLIETFNRADVVIPNADLLQTALVNWTHKNRFGRIDIPVGVAYSSDIERVENLLLACAAEHPKVLRWPVPQVLFMAFGASSLNFELRVQVANIEERFVISSDVRKAIVLAFRNADIEIPFPQTDVWMRAPPAIDPATLPRDPLPPGDLEDPASGPPNPA